jgi:rhodanese-related sulfurtransferase
MFARLMGLKTILPDELHHLIDNQQVTAFDVNSRQSWMNARVPGARNLDPVEFNESDLPSGKDSALVFYCSIVLTPYAGRRPTRLVEPKGWGTAMFV